MTPEGKFKADLRKRIEKDLPGSMVLHLDANERQGIPDLLVLYNNKWASLEGKKDSKASHQPNQDWYVEHMNEMSFSRFIYPENEEEVLSELYSAFKS